MGLRALYWCPIFPSKARRRSRNWDCRMWIFQPIQPTAAFPASISPPVPAFNPLAGISWDPHSPARSKLPITLPISKASTRFGRARIFAGCGLKFLRSRRHPMITACSRSPVALAEEMSPERIASMLKLSVADFAAHASTLSSPDELSLFVVRRLMHEAAPSLLWVTLHDIDVAHTGAFSLYLEGIRRSDGICAELWRTIQSDSEYKDKTNL